MEYSLYYPMQISDNAPIVDKYFHQCTKKVKQEHSGNLKYQVTRTIIFGTVFLLHCYIVPPQNQQLYDTFTFFIELLFFLNCFQVARLFNLTVSQLQDRSILINIANNLRHTLSAQHLQDGQADDLSQDIYAFQLDQDLGLKVSQKIYDFENMEKVEDVSEENREARQYMGRLTLFRTLQSKICCYQCSGCLLSTSALAILVYAIVLSLQQTFPNFQSAFLQFYILFQVMLKPRVLAILVIICLLPLILLVVGIYFCFCKKSEKVNLPEAQTATLQSITNCSDCAICFQNFIEEEKIVSLRCSQKHIFHETCITAWAKIKPICPICRSQI